MSATDPERVLITGASSGIGLATAIAYGRRGARIAMLARGSDGLEAAGAAVRDAGGETLLLPCDVREREALAAAAEAVRSRFGGLDVVVSAAAAASYGAFTATDPEDFESTIAVTLTGAANVCRSTLPFLTESSGVLVIVGSIVARMPLPLLSGYAAAKAGLRGFADSLRVELARAGSPVSVALVSPGPVDTPFWSNLAASQGVLPGAFPGAYVPEDVATAIVRSARRRDRGSAVGGGATLLQALATAFGATAARVMGSVTGWSLRHSRHRRGASPFTEPVGRGRIRGDLPAARRSLRVRLFRDGA